MMPSCECTIQRNLWLGKTSKYVLPVEFMFFPRVRRKAFKGPTYKLWHSNIYLGENRRLPPGSQYLISVPSAIEKLQLFFLLLGPVFRHFVLLVQSLSVHIWLVQSVPSCALDGVVLHSMELLNTHAFYGEDM